MVEGRGWKVVLELKLARGDGTRGIEQFAALTYAYDRVGLVTPLSEAKNIDPTVFDRAGLMWHVTQSDLVGVWVILRAETRQ